MKEAVVDVSEVLVQKKIEHICLFHLFSGNIEQCIKLKMMFQLKIFEFLFFGFFNITLALCSSPFFFMSNCLDKDKGCFHESHLYMKWTTHRAHFFFTNTCISCVMADSICHTTQKPRLTHYWHLVNGLMNSFMDNCFHFLVSSYAL